MSHIQHAVPGLCRVSLEIFQALASFCPFFFGAAFLTGKEVAKCSHLPWKLGSEEDIYSLTCANQQLALMLIELFTTNTYCLLSSVVVAAGLVASFLRCTSNIVLC